MKHNVRTKDGIITHIKCKHCNGGKEIFHSMKDRYCFDCYEKNTKEFYKRLDRGEIVAG